MLPKTQFALGARRIRSNIRMCFAEVVFEKVRPRQYCRGLILSSFSGAIRPERNATIPFPIFVVKPHARGAVFAP